MGGEAIQAFEAQHPFELGRAVSERPLGFVNAGERQRLQGSEDFAKPLHVANHFQPGRAVTEMKVEVIATALDSRLLGDNELLAHSLAFPRSPKRRRHFPTMTIRSRRGRRKGRIYLTHPEKALGVYPYAEGTGR